VNSDQLGFGFRALLCRTELLSPNTRGRVIPRAMTKILIADLIREGSLAVKEPTKTATWTAIALKLSCQCASSTRLRSFAIKYATKIGTCRLHVAP
jgi:hypothetical protein